MANMRYTDLQENILSREFYTREPVSVAKDLLGMILVRKLGDRILAGKITETEAYLSEGDEAAHNFKGMTNRNKSLYKDAGHVYVHQMRQWHLMDVVVDEANVPGSVLIRGVEPLLGINTMKKFRNTENVAKIANGPGKVGQAFQIDRTLDGVDITSKRSPIFISRDHGGGKRTILISERIGISKAKDKLLRFYV